MTIVKNFSLNNTGYSKGFQMLTNFVFQILAVEYRDTLDAYFTIKLSNGKIDLPISNINICGQNGGNFKELLSGTEHWIFHQSITNEDIVEIFIYEFDQYNIVLKIKELQKEQLAYGNQSAALEKSESISFEDKKTLRSHYSAKQTELQECINKLTNKLSVVGSETVIVQNHYSN
jgi:hypothetical protein